VQNILIYHTAFRLVFEGFNCLEDDNEPRRLCGRIEFAKSARQRCDGREIESCEKSRIVCSVHYRSEYYQRHHDDHDRNDYSTQIVFLFNKKTVTKRITRITVTAMLLRHHIIIIIINYRRVTFTL
jgi:hypothetical protein